MEALATVLDITIRFGIPLIMLFLVGCLIQRTDLLLRVVSRLLGEYQGNRTKTPASHEGQQAKKKEGGD